MGQDERIWTNKAEMVTVRKASENLFFSFQRTHSCVRAATTALYRTGGRVEGALASKMEYPPSGGDATTTLPMLDTTILPIGSVTFRYTCSMPNIDCEKFSMGTKKRRNDVLQKKVTYH
jgi:hypothetical protein